MISPTVDLTEEAISLYYTERLVMSEGRVIRRTM